MLSFVCSFVCFSLTLFLADGYYTDKKKTKHIVASERLDQNIYMSHDSAKLLLPQIYTV